MTPGLLRPDCYILRFLSNFRNKIRIKTLLNAHIRPDCYTFLTFFATVREPLYAQFTNNVPVQFVVPWLIDIRLQEGFSKQSVTPGEVSYWQHVSGQFSSVPHGTRSPTGTRHFASSGHSIFNLR